MSANAGLTGIVLAGGRSTRFGSDKASALFLGAPQLEVVCRTLATVCAELVVVKAPGQSLPPINVEPPPSIVEDDREGEGPLAGMIAGLRAAGTPLAFIVSTDVPLLRAALVAHLAERAVDYDIVLPVADGFPQPLVAVYRVLTALPAIQAAFDDGSRKILRAFAGLRALRVDEEELRTVDPDLESFRNANTPAELGALEEIARRR